MTITCISRSSEKYVWQIAVLLMGLLCLVPRSFAGEWGFKIQDAAAGQGALVTGVTPGTPAAAAGLKAGDIIVEARGKPVTSAKALVTAVKALPAGKTFSLRVSRSGWAKELELQPVQKVSARQREKRRLGLKVVDQPPDQTPGFGARITAVIAGGPAAKAGLESGDVITHSQGKKIERAKDFALAMRRLPAGQVPRLTIVRDGWDRVFTLRPTTFAPEKVAKRVADGEVDEETRLELAQLAYERFLRGEGPPPAGRVDRLKAIVAVGDFQVKAATASDYIGDGLREMLLTALHNSGYFIVVERMDMEGLAAEQAVSRSDLGRSDSGIPEGQMDVAEVLVSGAVTEFEPDTGIWIPSMIGGTFVAQRWGESHMAVDLSVVDVASGRMLAEKRIPGLAISFKASIAGEASVGDVALPVSLSMYRNTPMEYAIRDCVQKAAMYVVNSIPEDHYRHR